MEPSLFTQEQKPRKKLFRKSLKTRNKSEAIIKARYLWLIMEQIYKKYFKDAETYAKAMRLVAKSEFADTLDFESAREIYDEFDEYDEHLLELGKLQKDEDFLQELIRRNLSPQYTQQTVTTPKDQSPFLSELIDTWLEEKQRNIKPSTFISYKNQSSLFQEILSEINGCDIRVNSITPEMIRQYHALLIRMPSRRNSPRLKNKSFAELALLDDVKISPKTFHYYINVIIEFLTWMESQGYIENTRLKTILQSSKKNVSKKNTIQRVPFDSDDLKKIFENQRYRTGNFKKAADYWLPLIALFTGARIGEICQLMTSDIKKIEDVYCFDINEEGEGKSIKTADGSARTIPIHKELIRLNFIEYVDTLKSKGQTQLFPFEPKNKRNQYHSTQKRIAEIIKRTGIISTDKASKVFHSFRHTVRTRLVDLNIDERVIDSLVGHSSQERSIGNKVYTHSQLIKQKADAIKKLHFDVDLSNIRDWKYSKFKRAEVDLLK
jgi:integrase